MSDLLEIRDLHVRFTAPGGFIHAVKGVSLRVREGSIVALVGESGSGKSVVSQSILRILPRNGTISAGEILFSDPRAGGAPVDLTRLPADGKAMRAVRGARISMIFQEPMSSLSPLHTIGDQVGEALALHRKVSGAEAREATQAMLRLVGFPDPGRAWKSYPFELSGGLRQRAMIAMALVCRPALLIADEPTTALDVTIQAQILCEVQALCRENGTALIWITHDLSVVAGLADDIAVLYAGQVVERGPIAAVLDRARHPYTHGLIESVPSRNRRGVPLHQIPGTAPSPSALPQGCRFFARCERGDGMCRAMPALEALAPDHEVRCFHPLGESAAA
jgi:oligopeptide/dipeptide ABC transporter ATP-binding protein